MTQHLFNSAIAAPNTWWQDEFEWIDDDPRNLALEAQFGYVGPGGATLDLYVQSSFDKGAKYGDIANFHFTTSSGSRRINLSSLTPVLTQVVPTDAMLPINTALDGMLGGRIRVKAVSTGTYAIGTFVAVFATSRQLRKVA